MSKLGLFLVPALASMFACNAGDGDDPSRPSSSAPPEQTSGVTESGAESSAAAATDGNEGKGPAEVAAVKPTCESLAMTPVPAATFTKSGFGDSLIDVYVEESTYENTRSLTIGLTATAQECLYRANDLSPNSMSESRVVITRTSGTAEPPGEFQAGDYGVGDQLSLVGESGERCITATRFKEMEESGSFGSIGTAIGSEPVHGKITITKRTETTLEGSFDVVDHTGKHLTATFSAPICKRILPTNQKVVCCE